jgi:thiol peroxidase
MATITLKGTPIQTAGTLPKVGTTAPAFKLTQADLSDVGLEAFAGKKKVLNIVPSLDTAVCALSAQRFNREAGALADTVVINISADLPFAQKRFCESQSLKQAVNLSTMRSPSFGRDYGVVIVTGPLAGLMSRAVLVMDRDNKVVYAEQVPEIAQEPNYEATLFALKKAP